MNKSDEINAVQFTPIYDEKEDRLRLIININMPTRYDIWITRAFLIKILDQLHPFIEKGGGDSTAASTQEKSDKELPLYPFEGDIRVIEQLSFQKERDGLYILTFFDGNIHIKAKMSSFELSRLIEVILNQVRFRWGLHF